MKQNYQLSNVKSKMVAFKWMMIIFIMAFFVQARAQITFTNVTSMPPNCASSMDGSIFIEAMGIGQLQYSIDNGTTYQSSNTFFGLAAGPYYLWINDANNVPTQYPSNPIIINGPLPIIINDITKTNPSAAGMNDGNININASGGTGSLQYSIDYGNYYYATNTFTNLMSGTYGIFVRDANNCVDFYPSNPVHLIAPIPQVNLMSPENLATVNLRTNLSWEYNISANQYHIQISDNSSFSNIVFQDSTLYSTNLTLSYDLLNQNTNYYWRVRGKNGTASGPFSIYREFTTVAGQIPAPVNPEMPFNNDTIVEKNVNFYWQYSEFATKYILTLASDAGMSNVIDRDTVTNTNGYQFLNNNTTYFWNVKAINKYGESLVGITNKLTIDTAFIKHPITSNPSNNQTDVVIQPQLWWSYVNGASEYIVQVSTDTSVINIIWGDTTINTNTQVENGILNYNTSYFWRVRSKNSTRLSKFSPWSSFKTINNIPPIAPMPSVPYNNAILNQTFVGLGWNYVPLATVVLDTTYNSYENYNLFHNQTFYWTVSALNAFGASTGNPVWSFTVDTNYLEAPTLISPYNKKTNEPLQPYFGWNQVNKANEYIIEVSTDSTFASSIWTDTINNTYAQVPFNLANNTSYFWRIKAKRNAYQSAYSEIYNFKTEAAIPPMAPTIDSPKGNIIINNTQTMLNWYGVNATEYYLQVATDSSFNNIYHNDTLTTLR